MEKLEKYATLYVLAGATLWGVLAFFGISLLMWFGVFGKWIAASIGLAGAYAVYKYYKMNK